MSDIPVNPPGLINRQERVEEAAGEPQAEKAPAPKKEKKLPEEHPGFRWLSPDPVYCDHYSADSYGSIVRMSFGEYMGRNYYPIYRVAIAMPLSDVKSLIRSLTRVVEAAEAEAKTTPPKSE